MVKNELRLTRDWDKIEAFVAELEKVLRIRESYETIKKSEQSTRFYNGDYILNHKRSELQHDEHLACLFNKIVTDYVNQEIEEDDDDGEFI